MERAESLFLTVSEDHKKRKYPEYISRMSAPFLGAGGEIAAYEGVLLGGADRLFGLAELNLWLRRHRYAAYNMDILLPAAHLCLEYAVRTRMAGERPGIPGLASAAAGELLSRDPLHYRASSRDWLRIHWLVREFPERKNEESLMIIARLEDFKEGALELFESLVEKSAECPDARSLVFLAVDLYKEIFTKYFAPDHDHDPLPENDVFTEGEFEDEPVRVRGEEEKEETRELSFGKRKNVSEDGVELSEEDMARIPEYIERNFGRSFKTQKEMDEVERLVCVDIHEGRKVLFTDGFSDKDLDNHSEHAKTLRAYREANRRMLEKHQAAAHTGIMNIEQAFANVLNLMSDPERFKASHGIINNRALWKVGRVENPRLFYRVMVHERPSVAVEMLIDASGSQLARESMVALQSYMVSAGLSRVGIPHRVMSYCTYGDHTVLHRFRDYDEKEEADIRILDYHATSNNRDGLAFASAGLDLMRRPEEHKILLIFSDGLPNDMVSGRMKPGMRAKYVGDTAVRDTCAQVRRLRTLGAAVMGIFLGEDEELLNEKLIYGNNFLRIRRAEDFGGAAGKRLKEMLAQLE